MSSFGRRMKMLLNSIANKNYVKNKLELCRQDRAFEAKYSAERTALRRTPLSDRHPVDLYEQFIRDVMQRYLKKKTYDSNSSSNIEHQKANCDFSTAEASSTSTASEKDESIVKLELPDTKEEFQRKYRVLNSQQQNDALFKSQKSLFKQPTNDYEISCNTVQSAIHVNISFFIFG